jgi:uncharacterized membrane protein YfcA
MTALLLVALVVGALIGAVGVGGVLLIPAIQLLAGMPIHEAMATALFSFIFTGIVGTALFQRRGSIDWSMTLPLCVGGALGAFPGALAAARMSGSQLALALATFIIGAGAYSLASGPSARRMPFADRPRLRSATLLGIGTATGFGSGLTGVGGPALSVPLMVLTGFPTLATIGASQVVQILAAGSGSAGNMLTNAIDLRLGAAISVVEIVGVWLGVKVAHSIDQRLLRRGVGLLCIVVGAVLLVRMG